MLPCLALLQAVYHMPTSEDADPASSMPLALQSVFYKVPPCLPAGSLLGVGL